MASRSTAVRSASGDHRFAARRAPRRSDAAPLGGEAALDAGGVHEDRLHPALDEVEVRGGRWFAHPPRAGCGGANGRRVGPDRPARTASDSSRELRRRGRRRQVLAHVLLAP